MVNTKEKGFEALGLVWFKKMLILIFVFALTSCKSQSVKEKGIEVGAKQLAEFLPLLKNKRVAVLANHSSLIGNTHLVDTLISHQVNIVKVFAPEHGFRGDRPDGAYIDNSKDVATGLPIVSLYGKNKTLPAELLEDIDILIFDIQDVGVRFFTYISAMHYAMESCAKSGKKFIVLDRPNPNGMFVDGPILDSALQSYVGMHPIPVVHGLTVGELAKMINGENWLKDGQCDLTVVPVKNYDHNMSYAMPVKPSPNLPNDKAITLYPSLGLFEGTDISVGRGTHEAFLQIGHPSFFDMPHKFKPVSIEGMSKYPPHENKECFGHDLAEVEFGPQFTLSYVIDCYQLFEDKENYFKDYFNTLIGTTETMKQIQKGWSEKEIKSTWQVDLDNYKLMRKKYLLYPDFE